MKAISKINAFLDTYAGKSQLLLRVGLAIVFLYAAVSSFMSPTDWVGFLPEFVRSLFPPTAVLAVFSVVEIILAAWLLSGVYVRLAGAVAAVMLLGIVVSNITLLPISFRDIGLAFMALALVLMKEESPKESI